ncbi:hypothetical protein HA050_16560 [Iodobacter sp. HSC-16F04]|uniref:Uncharacterized protein n=1 Tax=Iodobacter violaceini TaxID=3044271 RepID=A0ABX0KSZ0_9NEIS|nr:hypothetical protein [Iodobacter violacea]NHQ87731.1 hypothetical protein [Iodobacter violacea]
MDITWLQGFTLGIALVGAVLGIINTWHSLDKVRVKLKVVPAHAIPYGGTNELLQFCIEITNLSAFPVTVNDAGVFFHGTAERGAIVAPVFTDNGHWPRRLEPRSSITVYSQMPRARLNHKIKCAYAKTQCGYTQTGSSPALKQIAANF